MNQYKRPRLDTNGVHTEPMACDESPTTNNRPFSAYLSNTFQQSKHPILSDKKLIVYNLKVERPPLPEGYEADALSRLRAAVHDIQHDKQPKESLEVLYQLCENLCQYQLGSRLCDHLCHDCNVYINAQFSKLEQDERSGIEYLESVNHWWMTYCDQMSQIRAIFLYLDRTVAASLHGSLWKLGMTMFGDVYKKCPNVREKVVQGILKLLAAERDGDITDSTLLQSALHMLIDLSLYHTDFEARLLQETRVYYHAEGDRLVPEMHMSEYLQHVANRLHQESVLRVKKFFDKSSKAQLNSIVEEELLTSRVGDILDKSFAYFMDNNRVDDLSMLYRLLRKVDALEPCVKHFSDYIKSKGTSLLRERVTDKDVITSISSFKRRTDAIVMHSFEEDERFMDTLRDTFATFINQSQNSATELLAVHIDNALRNSEWMDEHQLEKSLDQGMVIFRFLQGKDYFQALYKRDLARRLLSEAKSRNAEKNMLAKLRKECGLAYTSKLEGMLRDMKYSHDLCNEFKTTEGYDRNTMGAVKFSILTHGFWPVCHPVQMALPPAISKAQASFESFYTGKYNGRRLTWQNSLGLCEITANYPQGTKELVLTLSQAVVLLLFNDEETFSLSFSQILQATQLDPVELVQTLKSLACGEHQLLIKSPDGPDVQPEDMFAYNYDFTSHLQRIKMNTDKLNQVIESTATIAQTVLLTREQQMDAVIVRVMKAKQEMSHSALSTEVMRQLSFTVTAQEFKKRIEILLEKEFLQRTGNDGYGYLP